MVDISKKINNQGSSNPSFSNLTLPSVTLPGGGGAIKGIDEKFQVNPSNGTAGLTIPLPFTPGRGGFTPSLGLQYNSGYGNGIFGLGWDLNLPSILIKTDKRIPTYSSEDTFLFTNAEDLVPFRHQNNDGQWFPKTKIIGAFSVQRFRPRIENNHSKIEKISHIEYGVYWKVTTKNNVVTFFGQNENSRICDPDNQARIFKWLPDYSYDDKGNWISYEYKAENMKNVAPTVHERHRFDGHSKFANTYLKRIKYGNNIPYFSDTNNIYEPTDENSVVGEDDYCFEMVFDYGEHNVDQPTPNVDPDLLWEARQDPFSSFRPGFEVRTYRHCKRMLLFHHFHELGEEPCLVKSMDFDYSPSNINNSGANETTYLTAVTYTGYTKKEDGQYSHKSFPPLTYEYQELIWNHEVQKLSREDVSELPAGITKDHHWVDLYGEGIPGILYEEKAAWYYKENMGSRENSAADFLPSKLVSAKPSVSGFKNGLLSLQDLEGNGQKQLVVNTQDLQGYYELDTVDQYTYEIHPLKPFVSVPNINWNDPNIRLIDLNGDGRPELVLTDERALLWYESMGKNGYGASVKSRTPKNDHNDPEIMFSDTTQSIYLADFTGDGLTDIVRITNGEICYWPNRGYGHFGAKITMSNSPKFDFEDQYNPKHLYLADISGSGATDIIYLGKNSFMAYINQSGNGWSPVQVIKPFVPFHNHGKLSVIDLLGTGTSCIVWSSELPGEHPLQFIDLMSSRKPHVLTGYTNGMGKEVLLSYRSSTYYYLKDKRENNPWITKLPFPVQVIDRITTRDLVSSSELSTSYSYHHGYYDYEEKEFRGFGRIDQIDQESFDRYEEEVWDMPPVVTKTWIHTGSYRMQDRVSIQFRDEYYQDNSRIHSFPDSELENNDNYTYRDFREATRCLKGKTLRQELYCIDGSSQEHIPYTISESNFTVRQLQPGIQNQNGVFQALSRESINYQSERNIDDARIRHQFILEHDPYGHPLQNVEINYPRSLQSGDVLPEQMKLYAFLQTSEFENEKENYYRLGFPVAQKGFEISGLDDAPGQSVFSWGEIKSLINDLLSQNQIMDHHEEFSTGLQARVISATNYYYHQGDLKSKALLDHTEKFVMNDQWVQEVYDEKVSESMLIEAGYILRNGRWWLNSDKLSYLDSDEFYLQYQNEDVFGNVSSIQYDPHLLVAKNSTDALGNTIEAELNYRSLSIDKVTDINDSVSEAITDELGMVVAISTYGSEEGVSKGDRPLTNFTTIEEVNLENVISHPNTYLQEATSYFYYYLEPWEADHLPPHFVHLQREIHVSELDSEQVSPVQISLGYTDGFGRELQSKTKFNEDQWVVSARTVYNNKGKTVKKYEPFFSDTHLYESEEEIDHKGVTPILFYDGLGRLIRTVSPSGFHSMVRFTPWTVETYDFNDTILESEYFNKNNDLPFAEPEKKAIDAALPHYNTPGVEVLDSMGRPFRMEQVLQADSDSLITYREYNALGQVLTETDPRQFILNHDRGVDDKVNNYSHAYDLQGNILRTISQDSGTTYSLINVKGNPLYTWNARHFRTKITYDELHRPLENLISGADLNITAQKNVYGTDPGKNQNGQTITSFDQSGRSENLLFSFKGKLLLGSTQLCTNYKSDPDWEIESSVEMEPEVYIIKRSYNALGSVIRQVLPDGSVHLPEYYHTGLLKNVIVRLRGDVFGEESESNGTHFIQNITYNAKGQRTSIQYGNNVSTQYRYHEKTFRLISMLTQRTGTNGENAVLQDIRYIYDPVGNVIQVTDHSYGNVFHANQEVEPVMEYAYDALYQLSQATGRQHVALAKNSHHQHSDFFRTNQFAHVNDSNQLSNYSRKYTYDSSGNLTQIRHIGANPFTRDIAVSDKSNRAVPMDLPDNSSVENHFDSAGNLMELEHLAAISWNYRNSISSATVVEREVEDQNGNLIPVNDAEYYVYDGSGQRSRKVRESYSSTGNLLWVEEKIYLGSVEIKRKYQGSNRVLREHRSTTHVQDDNKRIALVYHWDLAGNASVPVHINKIHYQMGNHLGSASMELDDQGLLISYEEFFPFGGTAFTSGRTLTEVKLKEYRYTGKVKDDATGLYYYGARYYVPWLGRWMNPDPAGTVDGLNVYAYTNNSPINFVDPSGNFQVAAWGIYGQYIKQWITGDPAKEVVTKDGNVNIGALAEGTVYTAGAGAAVMGGIITAEAGLAYYGVTSTSIYASDVALGTSLAVGGAEVVGGDAMIGVGVDDAINMADNVLAKADDAFKVTKVDNSFTDDAGEMAFEIVGMGDNQFSEKAQRLLSTSSRRTFRRRIPRAIAEEGADHPYASFMTRKGNRPVNATKKPRKGGTHEWMKGQPTYWEAGHAASDRIGGNLLSIQWGYYNQTLGSSIEKSAYNGYKLTSVFEVQGIPVDAATVRYMDRIGQAPISQGVDNLPKALPETLLFDPSGNHVHMFYQQRNPARFQGN